MGSDASTDEGLHGRRGADTDGAGAVFPASAPRVRDAEATRMRILNAATDEFAEKGLAGARIARIATRARANQRMIYAYFTNKDVLFDAVLERHVLLAQVDIQLDPSDLPAYAGSVFDMYARNPQFAKLELWQALERPGLAASLPIVAEAFTTKLTLIEQGQRDAMIDDTFAPAALLDLILALVRGNLSLSGQFGDGSEHRRRDLATAVGRLVTPRPGNPRR